MDAAWAVYPKLNITLNMLKNQNVTKKQSSNEQLYRLDIARVRLVNNIWVKSTITANQQGLLQVPAFVPCDSFNIAKFFKAHFVDILA